MTKTVTRICNLISTLMIIACLAITAALIAPRLAGREAFAVMSGSMEPYYHVGSIVYVDKDISPEEIQVGDPITFRKADTAVATHRVIAIDEEARQFTTKGDANEVQDMAPVSFDNVIGKAGMSIPLLGFISLNITTKKGMIAAAAVVVVFILLQLIPEILKPEEKEGKSDE